MANVEAPEQLTDSTSSPASDDEESAKSPRSLKLTSARQHMVPEKPSVEVTKKTQSEKRVPSVKHSHSVRKVSPGKKPSAKQTSSKGKSQPRVPSKKECEEEIPQSNGGCRYPDMRPFIFMVAITYFLMGAVMYLLNVWYEQRDNVHTVAELHEVPTQRIATILILSSLMAPLLEVLYRCSGEYVEDEEFMKARADAIKRREERIAAQKLADEQKKAAKLEAQRARYRRPPVKDSESTPAKSTQLQATPSDPPLSPPSTVQSTSGRPSIGLDSGSSGTSSDSPTAKSVPIGTD